jgi:hypothetical protein
MSSDYIKIDKNYFCNNKKIDASSRVLFEDIVEGNERRREIFYVNLKLINCELENRNCTLYVQRAIIFVITSQMCQKREEEESYNKYF